MARAVMRWMLALLLAVGLPAWAQPLVRLDHIPTAVRDLDAAVADFRALGFAIKPGRPHANGLRNAHIKFVNGAGLELISAVEARDGLSGRYLDFLREGEGPAYLTLHASDDARTAAALKAAGIPHRLDASGLELTDPRLPWIFFAGDNRSPTDRPEHFEHANGALAVREVWVALDDAQPLIQLLSALGSRAHEEMRRAPFEVRALVFDLDAGGRIVIVPASHQVVQGHPLIAVTMAAVGKARWRPPGQAHGLWLGLPPDAYREVRTNIPTAMEIPPSCIVIQTRHALIHLDRAEVAGDAAYRSAGDDSTSDAVKRLQGSRAARLLALLTGEPTQGCWRLNDHGLSDLVYYAGLLIDRGHATIVETPGGTAVPHVTRIDRAHEEGANRTYQLPNGRLVLAFRTAVR